MTEANVHREDTERRVTDWLKLIDETISQQQVIVPPSSELFIELDESVPSCAYYFVNHDTRRIFWLEHTSTELLDMGMVVSSSHIGVYLNIPRVAILTLQQILLWKDCIGYMWNSSLCTYAQKCHHRS